MIYERHIIKSIFQGTLVTLLILTSIGSFVIFVDQLGSIGTKDYDFYQVMRYVLLKIPEQVNFSLSISVFIGSILSLGALASNNELVVLQASGMSNQRLIITVLKAASVIALISIILQQWVTPVTELSAWAGRRAAKSGLKAFNNNGAVWIKEGNHVIHIKRLSSKGRAKNIKIFELKDDRYLVKASSAKTAEITHEGWLLSNVKQTEILPNQIKTHVFKTLLYPGNLTSNLLKSMRVEPVQMSLTDLYQYQSFLGANGLENKAEKIMFWRRVYSPLSILITCTLAIPFVMGSQRGGQTGQRIMLGIMVGLSFVAIDRLVVRVSEYLGMVPQLSTFIPLLIFFLFNVFLMYRVSHKKD